MWRCINRVKDKVCKNSKLFEEKKGQCNNHSNKLISEASKYFKSSGRNSYYFIVQSESLKSKVCKPATAENDDFNKKYNYHRLNSKCHNFLNALHWVSSVFIFSYLS